MRFNREIIVQDMYWKVAPTHNQIFHNAKTAETRRTSALFPRFICNIQFFSWQNMPILTKFARAYSAPFILHCKLPASINLTGFAFFRHK